MRRALESVDVRAKILELLSLGYRLDMSASGIGASRLRGYYAPFEAPELPALLGVLEAIQAALPRFDPSEAMPAPKQTPWMLIVAGRDREIFFPSWRPDRPRGKVGTSWAVFRTLQKNDTIEIDTRPGALGWTWVPEVRKVP